MDPIVELLQVMSVAHTWLTRLISNLKSLNLSNNRLTGTIPAELGFQQSASETALRVIWPRFPWASRRR